MLKKFEIHGVHTNIDDNLRKYINKKIGKLDRYLPRKHHDASHMEIRLKESSVKNKKEYTCEATLVLPQDKIVVKENTMNMYAAVDIVEAKLKQQIKKYKDLHGSGKMRRHLFGRMRRRPI